MNLETIRHLAGTAFRVVFFRADRDELRSFDRRHLAFGLLCTWIVGIGRWWEDPRANLVQHLGLGSVAYVFVLALFLWLVLWPMNPEHWSYRNVLTFISLTSLPGILYAIPVRHGLVLEAARKVRLLLLMIVSIWRVALLGFYLSRGAGLRGSQLIIGTLFPLGLIVFALTAMNLEKVVFDLMGEIEPQNQTVNDTAYQVLFLISMLSVWLMIPTFLCYLGLSAQALTLKRKLRKGTESEPKSGPTVPH